MLRFLIRRILTGLSSCGSSRWLVFALFFAVPNGVARRMAGHMPPRHDQADRAAARPGRPDRGSSTCGSWGTRCTATWAPTTTTSSPSPGDQGGAPDHPVARDRRGHHLDGPRHRERRGLRGQAPQLHRPIHHRAGPDLLLGAVVRPGPDPALLLLLQADRGGVPDLPRRRLQTALRRVRTSGSSTWSCRGSRLRWSPWRSTSRLTRGSMLEVLGEDYIKTARSKGIPERRVVYRHALRSALTPVLTQFGIDLGALIGGAVITETVFSLPGVGYQSLKAIRDQDLPLIIGVVLVAVGCDRGGQHRRRRPLRGARSARQADLTTRGGRSLRGVRTRWAQRWHARRQHPRLGAARGPDAPARPRRARRPAAPARARVRRCAGWSRGTSRCRCCCGDRRGPARPRSPRSSPDRPTGTSSRSRPSPRGSRRSARPSTRPGPGWSRAVRRRCCSSTRCTGSPRHSRTRCCPVSRTAG